MVGGPTTPREYQLEAELEAMRESRDRLHKFVSELAERDDIDPAIKNDALDCLMGFGRWRDTR